METLNPKASTPGEAAEIVRRLRVPEKPASATEQKFLAQITADVFRREFEEEIGSDKADRIAYRILALVDSENARDGTWP